MRCWRARSAQDGDDQTARVVEQLVQCVGVPVALPAQLLQVEARQREERGLGTGEVGRSDQEQHLEHEAHDDVGSPIRDRSGVRNVLSVSVELASSGASNPRHCLRPCPTAAICIRLRSGVRFTRAGRNAGPSEAGCERTRSIECRRPACTAGSRSRTGVPQSGPNPLNLPTAKPAAQHDEPRSVEQRSDDVVPARPGAGRSSESNRLLVLRCRSQVSIFDTVSRTSLSPPNCHEGQQRCPTPSSSTLTSPRRTAISRASASTKSWPGMAAKLSGAPISWAWQ